MYRHPDEQRSEHSEDVRLNERHEQLQEIDEEHEAHRDGDDEPGPHDENEPEERQDHDMPAHHVGEKPDAQGEGLGHHSDDLHRHHDDHHPRGDTRGNQVLQMGHQPILADAGRLHHDKGYESETESDADV